MKAWLDTSKPEKFAPIAVQNTAGFPNLRSKEEQEEDELDRKTKELANDAEEDEAEAEQNDRKLDVEATGQDAAGGKKGNGGDFLAELTNAWLASQLVSVQ